MSEQLKILMLEDQEDDAGLVDRILQKENFNFVRTRVDTREDFMAAVVEMQPDVILSDHSLPQFNSIEALEICKELKVKVPFILVTGAVSEEFAVNCLRMGADDYVLKTNLSRLPQALRQALAKHQAELNRLSQEEELKRQNGELSKVNQEMDAFIYRISHDLRSPLSSVLGLLNVAKAEGCYEGHSGEYFKMIEGSVKRLDKTLLDIFDFYNNSRGPIVFSEVKLNDAVPRALEQLKFLDANSPVRKEITIQQDADFYTDVFRFHLILINLLSNAIKYRDERKTDQWVEVRIKISVKEAVIEVEDNGIGIEEDISPHIFTMFYRGTEKSQGAGLGLYITREIVNRLMGTIVVNSEAFKGTTVTVTLPNTTG